MAGPPGDAEKLKFTRPINWVFNPAAAMIAGTLGEQSLIYYCVDEYTAFTGVPSASLAELEKGLAQKADLVVVSSDRLLKSKLPLNANTHLVRHGVDFEHFRRALDVSTETHAEMANLPRPILGYFGLIAADWIDLPLLVAVAKRFPQASLVMLGKVTMDVSELSKLPNVHLLGRKPYADLPAYAKAFDVALIPFPISEATLNSNPLKAREYLAAGLPVISTRIPEVEVAGRLPNRRTDAESFCWQIELALQRPGPDPDRSDSMRTEGWSARLGEIASLFAGRSN